MSAHSFLDASANVRGFFSASITPFLFLFMFELFSFCPVAVGSQYDVSQGLTPRGITY